MGKVEDLSDFTDDCMQLSPGRAVAKFAEFLIKNPDFDKVLLIALNTKEGRFNYYWIKGRMMNSEGIAVLDLTTDDLRDYIKRGEE